LLALVFADNPKGVSEKGVKRAGRLTEKEFKELVKKGYLEHVEGRSRIVKKYRTTESGRAYCVENIWSLPVLRYVRVKEAEQLSAERFLETLRLKYSDLVKTSPIAPYVKISDLRLKVSEELNISGDEFDRRIIELNSSDPYAVQLHAGSGESDGGLKTARGVYHYAIVK
jgi:DNA-binding PadR family transcriptional regulator